MHRQSRAVHLCDVSIHHNRYVSARQTHCDRKSRVIHRIAITLTHLDCALGCQHFKGSRLCTRYRNGRLADLHALRAAVRRYIRTGILYTTADIEKRYEVLAVDEQSFHPCHRCLQSQHHTVQHKYRSSVTHTSTPP